MRENESKRSMSVKQTKHKLIAKEVLKRLSKLVTYITKLKEFYFNYNGYKISF